MVGDVGELSTPHATQSSWDSAVAQGASGVAVGMSVVCLALHVVLVVVGGLSLIAMSLPMLGLSLVCASCSFRRRRRRCGEWDLGLMGLSGLAMVGFHLAKEHHGHLAGPMAPAGGAGGGHLSISDLLLHGGVTAAIVQSVLVAVALVAGRLARR